jgi:hypothetical protein
MLVQTKFLRLCKPVSLGDHSDDWRVSWLGGWDKCRVFFVVMVESAHEQPARLPDQQHVTRSKTPSVLKPGCDPFSDSSSRLL